MGNSTPSTITNKVTQPTATKKCDAPFNNDDFYFDHTIKDIKYYESKYVNIQYVGTNIPSKSNVSVDPKNIVRPQSEWIIMPRMSLFEGFDHYTGAAHDVASSLDLVQDLWGRFMGAVKK